MTDETPFEGFNIKAKRYLSDDMATYRIYTSRNSYERVKAENAAMAVLQSDIKNPFKVVRESRETLKELQSQDLEDTEEKVVTDVDRPSQVDDVMKFDLDELPEHAEEMFEPMRLSDMHARKTAQPEEAVDASGDH